jgi:MoxR-like ATPase
MADEPRADEWLQDVRNAADRLTREVQKVIVGQDDVIEQVLISLFTRSHALLVGVPGLAKTLLVSTIAQALRLEFNRIQFTPDLMPSDITGTEVIEENRETGRRVLRFVRGPVFANLLLADEVNRTPPKTQAALLEAMQERHVTVSGERHDLPSPFFVLATQNPIEQEGTYPLPEAQLDRFLFQIQVGYPSEAQELEIVRRTTSGHHGAAEPVLDAARVEQVQGLVRDVPVADHVIGYALRLVRATRGPGKEAGGQATPDARPESVRGYVEWGAGPRASQSLILAAKARAVLRGRTHADVDDVRAVAHPVLRHRVLLGFVAEADGVSVDDVIDRLIDATPVEGPSTAEADAVLR